MARDKSPVLVDGPLPVYYEPIESPTTNIYYPKVQNNPVVKYRGVRPASIADASKDYPYVLCTGFIHEMWGGGAMTRGGLSKRGWGWRTRRKTTRP